MARPLGAQNKDKPFRAALVRQLELASNNPDKLDAIARALIESASGGDIQAINQIADRLDGKPAQAITGGDDDDAPLKMLLKVRDERTNINAKFDELAGKIASGVAGDLAAEPKE